MKKWAKLLFLFVLFSFISSYDVFALTTGELIPSRFSVQDYGVTTSENFLNITSYNYANTNVYGYTTTGTSYRNRISWYYDNVNLDLDNTYDFTFFLYLNVQTNSFIGIRGYLEDSNHFKNYCIVDSNRWKDASSGYSSYSELDHTVTVSCQNVVLTSNSFSFKIADVSTELNGLLASSSISYKSSQNSEIASNTKKQYEESKKTNDSINDTNVSDSQSQASSFFGSFQSESHGLSGVVSAPLRLIRSLSSSSCSSLSVPLPFVNQNITLVCMSSIYNQYFSSFLTLYRLITTGLIGYWVLIRLFSKVKDFQNPDNTKVEVFDL